MSSTTTEPRAWDINAIQDANQKAGNHWFSASTMRFFGSRVLPDVYQGPGGVFFVTSDKAGFRVEDGREYNVRQFDPADGSVGTASDPHAFNTRRRAIARAKYLAGQGATVTTAAHRPLSVFDDFVTACRRYGRPDASEKAARELIGLAAAHHRLQEQACNGFHTENATKGHATREARTEKRILELAAEVGAVGVNFGGDPRGATVKLKFPNGESDSMGRDGWCVPTSETEK